MIVSITKEQWIICRRLGKKIAFIYTLLHY